MTRRAIHVILHRSKASDFFAVSDELPYGTRCREGLRPPHHKRPWATAANPRQQPRPTAEKDVEFRWIWRCHWLRTVSTESETYVSVFGAQPRVRASAPSGRTFNSELHSFRRRRLRSYKYPSNAT